MAKKKDESPAPPPTKATQPGLPLGDDPSPDDAPAPEKVPDPDWYVGEVDEAEDWPDRDRDPDRPLDAGDFHTIAQKQILNAVFAILSDTKMDWNLVEPFYAAARDVLLGDIEETAQVRLHNVQQSEDGSWVEADEAYLGISVSDRDRGDEWLSDTRWLSEIAIAEDDPEQVRAIVRALERSIAKINAWLEERGGPASPAAPRR
ncbi:MAG TPA: hypothetical protein VMG08_20865 [Allosphingosinicella sp.]|nr:hypothetical protein [Allosphingosinicella sp.]